MIEIYNDLYNEYKQYITSHTNYNVIIVKDYTSKSTDFPVISFQLINFTDTDYASVDLIDKYEEIYLTIDIYTKNKTIDSEKIASQVLNDELTKLTIDFFNSKRMKRMLCRLTPNLDTSITRRTMQYQALVSSYRKNIIRR